MDLWVQSGPRFQPVPVWAVPDSMKKNQVNLDLVSVVQFHGIL